MGVRLVLRFPRAQEGDGSAIQYEFAGPRVLIGRRSDADVELPHAAVSATHATLRARGPRFVLVDEGSTNGTKVNGTRLPPGRPKSLRSGDRVEIGPFELAVELGPTGAGTSAERTAALARRLLREALAGTLEAPAAPALVVTHGPRKGAILELPPAPARLVLGRGDDCDLTLPDGDCSREHAEIVHDLDGVLLRDLGSKNGTFRNGHELREGRLKDRDELRLGATFLTFEDEAEARRRALHGEADTPFEELGESRARPTTPHAGGTNADAAPGASAPKPVARDPGSAAPLARAPDASAEGADTRDGADPQAADPLAADRQAADLDAVDPGAVDPGAIDLDSAAPARVDLTRGAVPRAPGAPRSLRARPRRAASADLVLYLLAGAVLAISLAGLVWLLRT